MKKLILLIIILQYKIVFTQVPFLSGTIEVSISKGTIDGNMTLSKIPSINDYVILLNTGLNLEYIKNSDRSYNYYYNKTYNREISYESFLYSLNNEDGKFLPKELHFKYTGKFPVKKDTINMTPRGDWKGNIAFNGQNLRMDGLQTNWYPVIKDLKKDKSYEEITYDIRVICNDCETLYVNGNNPVKSQNKQFKTDSPTEILLFVGNYDFYKSDGIFYLNPDISEGEIKEFSNTVKKFKDFYSNNLRIPFNGNFNFVQTLPTSKSNSFLFVVYPSIVNIGRDKYGLKGFVSKKNSYAKPLIAHELGHYYFGSGLKKFNSEIGIVIQEGFAEYLSLLASKHILGNDVYNSRVEHVFSQFEKFKSYIPVSKISESKDLRNYNIYVYHFFPATLLSIEKDIGEDKMWKWMQNLLTEHTEFTDYDFLIRTLKNSIGDDKKTVLIIEEYLNSDNALENITRKR